MEGDIPVFTRAMRHTHTILLPGMAIIQFSLLANVLKDEGYNVKLLQNEGPQVVQKGLRYVHNDTCYPALLVIGQMIDALDSGTYDLDHVALAITQTGGGCRASNYIHLLRKALVRAGYCHIPVLSLNLKGLDRHSGFQITLRMLRKGLAAIVCGDALKLLSNQVSPYEKNHGETQALVQTWITRLSSQFRKGRGHTRSAMRRNLHAMVAAFAAIDTDYSRPVVKVGIVGEIYMKYAPLGNNHLEDFLAQECCEVMVPGIMGFVLYGVYNQMQDITLYGGSALKVRLVQWLLGYLISLEEISIEAIRSEKSEKRFTPQVSFRETIESAQEVIGLGCKMGEGWLLTGEMRDLAKMGYTNIICVQPFGCLPNHIVGKGMIRKLKELDAQSNIVPIDYDPSATRVNQENRIKLMLAVAAENRDVL